MDLPSLSLDKDKPKEVVAARVSAETAADYKALGKGWRTALGRDIDWLAEQRRQQIKAKPPKSSARRKRVA